MSTSAPWSAAGSASAGPSKGKAAFEQVEPLGDFVAAEVDMQVRRPRRKPTRTRSRKYKRPQLVLSYSSLRRCLAAWAWSRSETPPASVHAPSVGCTEAKSCGPGDRRRRPRRFADAPNGRSPRGVLALRRTRSGCLGEPGERRLVRRDHRSATAALERHVADGHLAFH